MTRASVACCWFLCIIISLQARATSTSSCARSDLDALRSFAASFPTANFSDWEVSDDCCAWGPSVLCSPPPSNMTSGSAAAAGVGSRRVIGLFLDTVDREMFNYPIPISVCLLSSLTFLRLTAGDPLDQELDPLFEPYLSLDRQPVPVLIGPIPPCIGTNLLNLVDLDFSFNSLTGQIPLSFSRLHSLQSLDLSYNFLSGPPFPYSLYMPNLTILALSHNAFSGPIPSVNSTHHKLSILSLSSNSFSGTIASLLAPNFTFTSLGVLDVSTNILSGGIPTSFDPSRFPLLSYLLLDANLFEGSLPESLICGLANLTYLSFSNNAFSQLPAATGYCRLPSFHKLRSFYASYNQFKGSYPESIGSLSNLEDLDLSYNSFNGSLPKSWQNLASLYYLYLSGNSLVAQNPSTPKLPSWVFTLPSISTLALSFMKLQDVDLDCSSLLQMLNIQRDVDFVALDFSYNNFSSDLLQCLSSYTFNKTTFLNLSGNPLGLDLDNPDSVKRLPRSLASLDVSSCELRGPLTSLFFDRIGSSVRYLYLANNHLVGQVAAHLGNLSQLSELDLSHNHLTGFAPLVDKLNFLRFLQLSNNNLVGDLSSFILDIFNMSQLTSYNYLDLDVSHNSLTGFISPYLWHYITNAHRLMLNDNNLEGSIPHELFENSGTPELQILSLSNNHLSGHIPSSFRNLKSLVFLDLRHNRFEGSLQSIAIFDDASFGQYTRLRVLLLGYNNFTGSVPTSLANNAPSLQLIDLSNNHLTGPIPVHTLQSLPALRTVNNDDGNGRLSVQRGALFEELRINLKGGSQTYQYVFQALTSVDFSSNNLSGPISTGLGELAGLVYLNLSRNGLSGSIPSDLGNLSRQMQSLDMSFNKLVGPIPDSFHNLTGLEVFNVSYNPGLSGPIPLNQPQFQSADSYIGDPNLCGDPILESCSAIPNPPSIEHSDTDLVQDNKSNGFVEWIDEWIAIPGFCLGIVVGFSVTLYALMVF